ncbi:hypothetical protein Golax_010222, partial [Gossypium laxum]|nr:hypothetical protein [Gossypium laxum]
MHLLGGCQRYEWTMAFWFLLIPWKVL